MKLKVLHYRQIVNILIGIFICLSLIKNVHDYDYFIHHRILSIYPHTYQINLG